MEGDRRERWGDIPVTVEAEGPQLEALKKTLEPPNCSAHRYGALKAIPLPFSSALCLAPVDTERSSTLTELGGGGQSVGERGVRPDPVSSHLRRHLPAGRAKAFGEGGRPVGAPFGRGPRFLRGLSVPVALLFATGMCW